MKLWWYGANGHFGASSKWVWAGSEFQKTYDLVVKEDESVLTVNTGIDGKNHVFRFKTEKEARAKAQKIADHTVDVRSSL